MHVCLHRVSFRKPSPHSTTFSTWQDQPAYQDALSCLPAVQQQAAGAHHDALAALCRTLSQQGGVLSRDVQGWALELAMRSAWGCADRGAAAEQLTGAMVGAAGALCVDQHVKRQLETLAAWGSVMQPSSAVPVCAKKHTNTVLFMSGDELWGVAHAA